MVTITITRVGRTPLRLPVEVWKGSDVTTAVAILTQARNHPNEGDRLRVTLFGDTADVEAAHKALNPLRR